VLPGIGLQGLVLFALYVMGIAGAFGAALLLRRTVTKGATSGFMMEMPKYQMPRLRDVLLGLWQRAEIFLKRAGTIILLTTMVLWALLSFPKPPEGSGISQGRLFDRRADRQRPADRGRADRLQPRHRAGADPGNGRARSRGRGDRHGLCDRRSRGDAGQERDPRQSPEELDLPTALAFLMWFVFAPQCISTIAVTRRETNGWKWPAFMVGYLFALAYVAAGITYWSAVALGSSAQLACNVGFRLRYPGSDRRRRADIAQSALRRRDRARAASATISSHTRGPACMTISRRYRPAPPPFARVKRANETG
jgi:ferrous iron transport protein B